MADRALTSLVPFLPPEVQAFAAERGVSRYLPAVIDLVRRAFPSHELVVSLAQDAEDETRQYIALDVEVGGLESEALLTGQRAWSAGLPQVCPSRQAVCFVLGWR